VTHKTPEEIAAEVLHGRIANPDVSAHGRVIKAAIIAAIKVDRAQRHQPPVGRVFVETVTETPLTEAQFEAVCRCVPYSSIPDALRIIVGEVLA
jgi:hypothetical protein